MGEIVINRGAQKIDLFSLIPFVTVTKAEHVQDLLSTDRITLSIASSQPMLFYLGDYIVYGGRKFTLNLNPTLQKQAEDVYLYDMQFEGVQYDLLRKKYFNYDAQGFYTTGDFPLTGEINVFLTALINNAKRDETDYTWILGYYPAGTETKTITFSNVNCLAALQTICQEFEQEFEIIQDMVAKTNTLYINKVGELRDYQFEYGYGNGLYSLKRDNVSEGQVITRLYPYGSTENIPTNYRNFSPRLRLPESYGKNYIQDNAKVALFGLVEEIKNYDDIKPTFKGIVSGVGTAVTAQNTFSVSISNMDFDLNEKKADGVSTKYLIDGTPAKIHVNKGNLAGYDFEIHKYTHATKTFEIKVFADERGQKFPDLNTIFKFAVGDEITLLDIIMPDVYITNAENKLKDKALEDYDKLSQNNVKYSLDIDPMFFANIGGGTDVAHLTIGDYISVKDSALGIQKTSRIISLTRDLLANDGYKYSADISDSYEISIVTQILQDIQNVQTQVGVVVVRNKEAMLAGYKRMKELQGLVFDPDGYFDPTNIKPNSIETNMLTVGAKSQQLSLESVIITANKNNDPNLLSITAGKLIHFSISDTGIKEWNLTAINKTLPTNEAYYIYARVPRTGTTGTFNIVTSKLKFDSEDLYYNFLVAVVFSPSNNLRMTELMYGSTFIHGRTITTGRITSVDGLTWFDLDTGELHGKFTFTDGTNVQTAVAGAQSTADSASTAAANAQAAAANANTAISNLNTYVDGAFADGIISEAEAIAIEKYINAVNTEYNAFDNQYNILYNNSYLAGTPKTNLESAKTAYNTAKNNLLLSINTAIADGKTTTAEKSDVDSKYSIYKTALGTLQQRIEEANTSIQSYLNNAAANAQTAADNANNAVASLNNYVDGAFSDGIISEAEAIAIEKYINTVNTEKEEFNNQYNILYSNPLLTGIPKTNLLNAKTGYNAAITNLINSINTAIADKQTTPAEKADVDSKYNTYKTALGTLQTRFEESNTSIQAYLNTAVSNAQATANSAMSGINDMANDNKLTANEKQINVVEWNRIKQEYTQNSSIANTLGISLTAYQNAYNALNTYITPLLADLTTTSTIDGTTFRNNFQNYYTQNVSLVQAIENKKIDNVQIGGRNFLRNSDFQKAPAWNGGWVDNGGGWEMSSIYWQDKHPVKTTVGSGLRHGWIKLENGKEYTFSAFILSDQDISGNGVFPLNYWAGKDNVPEGKIQVINFDTTLVANAWKLIYLTFKLTGDADSFTPIIYRGSGNAIFRIAYTKLEKGNKATDWTPAPEDIESDIATVNTNSANALAQAQTALNTAAATAAVTSFMQTTIDGNVVSTGTLQVGDVNGANAMISGVTDRPNGESIRFAAGKNYANKYRSPYQVLDNGMVRFVNPLTGQTAFELGFNQSVGKVVFNIYDDNGNKIIELGSQGIIFNNYISDSWNPVDYFLIPAAYTASNDAMSQYIHDNLIFTDYIDTPYGNYASITVNKTSNYWKYLAGRSYDSQNYVQYENFYYATDNNNNKPTPSVAKLADGWYTNIFQAKTEETPGLTAHYNFSVNAFKVVNGQLNQVLRLTITGSHIIRP